MEQDNNKKYFRSFAFYNDRANNFRHKMEDSCGDIKCFRTLGYFDEFKTQKIPFDIENGDMDFLWKSINGMNEELISSNANDFNDESFQNIFGFPFSYAQNNDNVENELSDKDFWSKDDYAFTFVILIQFFSLDENSIKLKEKIVSFKKKFIEHINDNFKNYQANFLSTDDNTEEIRIQKNGSLEANYILTDYITFDRYDYILTVKSNCYLPLILAMQQLYSLYSNEDNKKVPIALNSFTVTAINPTAKDLINETLPSICIKCNYDENNIFSYNTNNLYENRFNVFESLNFFELQIANVLYENESINKDYRLYYISGEDDVRIIARKVKMRNLFRLFCDNTILRNQYLFGFSTVINVLHDCEKATDYILKVNDEHKIEEEIKNCKNLIKKLSNRYPSELIKTLHQINSGLSAIRPMNINYRGYAFYSLFTEFRNFIEILEWLNKPIELSVIEKAFKITHSFGAALLTTVRSDFREFQIPTFNANLYYAPTKMLVFYRAFVAKLLESYDYLNEGSKEHFIINTGNETTTRVNEMLSEIRPDGTTEKFFICNMSEKNIYMIKNSMLQLNHEIAHFGMKKIRNRKKRTKYIIDTFCRAYFLIVKLFLFKMLSERKQDVNDVFSKCSEYINSEKFNAYFLNRIRKIYINRTQISNDKLYLKEMLRILNNILKDNENQIIDEVISNIVNNISFNYEDKISVVYTDYKDLCNTVKKSFKKANEKILYNFSARDAVTFVYFIEYYFKECFADAIAILTLNLSPKDYLEGLLKVSMNEEDITYPVKITLKYRFYIVLSAFYHVFGNLSVYDEEVTDNLTFIKLWDITIFDSKNDIKEEINRAVLSYKNYLNKEQVDFCGSWFGEGIQRFLRMYLNSFCSRLTYSEKLVSGFFYDKSIFNNFQGYLVECIELFLSNYKNVFMKNKSFLPYQIYHNISEDNVIDGKILYLDSVLSDFESKCFKSLTTKGKIE